MGCCESEASVEMFDRSTRTISSNLALDMRAANLGEGYMDMHFKEAQLVAFTPQLTEGQEEA